jgi:hypothetical protein
VPILSNRIFWLGFGLLKDVVLDSTKQKDRICEPKPVFRYNNKPSGCILHKYWLLKQTEPLLGFSHCSSENQRYYWDPGRALEVCEVTFPKHATGPECGFDVTPIL